MQNPIVEKIMKEGIRSVNISMLSDESKTALLLDVGDKLFKESRYNESAEILSLARATDKLTEMGDMLSSQGRTETAVIFYLPTKNKEKLNESALKCINSKNYRLAALAYEASGNIQMAQFIRENFQ
jgi:hypothetical protein